MSSLKVFSVYDSKAEVFMNPFMMSKEGQALRAIVDEVSNKDSLLSKHSEDYTLYCIAEFDQYKGEYVNLSPLKNLGRVDTFKEMAK